MDAPSADDVGNILIYVVPGFFARLGYLARFPGRPQDPSYAFIVSVALSVPLVALTSAAADHLGLSTEATNAGFASLLVVVGLLAGYLAALTRSLGWVRRLLRRGKIRFDPEATVYEQTLLELESSPVSVSLKDGRTVSGQPILGPGYEEPGSPRELYLVDIEWRDDKTGDWTDGSKALIVNLDEVVMISMDEDPVAS